MAKVVLYTYWRSSSSYRVRFALAHKKIPYESVAVNIREGEHLKDEHVQRSPTGYVPCLVVDGKPVVESVAIIELLDELFPDVPLYPRDAWARARVRSLVEVVNSGIQPLQNMAVLKHLSSDPAAQKEWARHFNARGLAAFERLMEVHERERGGEASEGRFAYGDTLTAADIFLVPQMYSAQRFGVDLTPYPRAVAAAEAALATEAAQAAIPERQPDALP